MVDNSNIHNYFWCNDPSARFKLGMWWSADPAHPNGTFDELAMWSRPLSAREIQNMYSEQLNPYNASVNARGCVVFDQYQPGEVFSLDSGSTFYTAADSWLLQNMKASGADLSKVCTSLATSMSNLFMNDSVFDDISSWDVSNVTNMRSMFHDANIFNQDIGNWDVSNATNMRMMFLGASAFDQDIGGWDVSNVTDMNQMFGSCTSFDQDIGGWDVSSAHVGRMDDMFRDATVFDQDLTAWCVTNIPSTPANFCTNSALAANHHPIWGTCASACADLIDSVETVNFLSGAYRLWMNTPLPNASSYRVEWKPDTASTWRSKLVRHPNSGQQRFNIIPWFNNTIAVRVAVVDSSGTTYSCEETFNTPCRPLTL